MRSLRRLVGAAFTSIVTSVASAQTVDLASLPQPLGTKTLPDKPAGAHWVWIADFAPYASSSLVNADSGEVYGTLELGVMGMALALPRRNSAIYNHAIYMSRGFRGERTEVVEIFDGRTLAKQGEIETPSKAMRGWSSPTLTALTDDDRFLLTQFFTPALSIGIVDLASKKFVGEIETSGCAHVMAAGPRRFLSLCGDGSLLAVDVDESGAEKARKRHPEFFESERDPLHASGVRAGDVWYFASHRGMIHAVDVSSGRIRFQKPWKFGQADSGGSWVPATPIQHLAVHEASGRMFVLMAAAPSLEPKPAGYDFHRLMGTEVWTFDLRSHKRIDRFVLKHAAAAIAVSQDSAPLLYATTYAQADIYDARTGTLSRELLPGRELSLTSTPIIIQPVR